MGMKAFFIIAGIFLGPINVEATLTVAQQQAIDRYIFERSKSSVMIPSVVRDLQEGLDGRITQLENQVLPLSVVIQRNWGFVEALIKDIETHNQQARSGASAVNPYEDAAWLSRVRPQLVELCCEIRNSPERQRRIFSMVGEVDVREPDHRNRAGERPTPAKRKPGGP